MKKNIIIGVMIVALIGLFVYATSVKSTTLTSNLTVSEQLTSGGLDQNVRHKVLNEVVNYRPTTDTVTSDVDNLYSASLTTSGTIDLTSVTNTLGNTLDLTGERVVAVKFKNIATTGNDAINVTQGATNPYPLFGSTFSLDLQPRQSILYKADTMLTDVDASNLGIDYTLNGDTLGVILITANLY